MSNYTTLSQVWFSVCLLVFISAQASAQEVSFNRDVRPILSDRCFHCHGPDAENQDSDFRLDTRANALEDLGGYAGIVPGDLDQSELHVRIRTEDEGEQMPPADSVRQLSEKEKNILDAWIQAGAPFDGHWSFNPIPHHVAIPESGKNWARNKIDRFVFKEMQANEFSPNQPAPRDKWLRRVTFDLTGLPPSIQELDSFIGDASDQAYEKVVDRLLQTDACAERLTSEWLDVARYSDSFGYQRDDERYVWPYRDWVMASFKDNLPYDQFVAWQLAGDLMEDPTRDQIVATAFNRLHSHKKEGGVALEEFRVENVADRTQTFASAFMGLTMECARCHDHKYDPTKTREYYQLSSFFANIDERGLISYFTDAVPTPTHPMPSPQQGDQLASATEAVDLAEEKWRSVASNSKVALAGWVRNRQRIAREISGLRPSNESMANDPGMPGLVASLSFETIDAVPEGEYQDEEGKKISGEQIRGLVNDVDDTESPWTGDANSLVAGVHGNAMRLTGDDAIVLPGIGHYGRHQPFSVSTWIHPTDVDQRAVIYRRSRGWDDAGSIGYELTQLSGRLSAKLVHFWPGNAICVETDEMLESGKWHHVTVTYDGSSKAAGLKIFVNGSLASHVVQDHLTRNITQWRQGYNDLAIGARYRDRGFKGGQVDEFRVFGRELSSIETAQLFDAKSLTELLKRVDSGGVLTEPQRIELGGYFLAAIYEPAIKARVELASARKRRNEVLDSIPALTVMREQETPRPAFVLKRGAYDQPGDSVTANTPKFLPAFPVGAPHNRLGLAQWLTSPDHPLLARVTVNRYWQMLFGKGIVRTPEDFGLQGQPPTHPELLDWLARDFIDNHWDVRRLLRTIVLSSTYRQSAIVTRLVRDVDPENVYLARGPGQRLSAEMIRDNALASSSLLDRTIGGPPTKPYDVALAYTPMPVDRENGLYRRSLYTFWKRTAPSPVMMTMNASKRDVCRLRREVTDSPLQALVLLNGSQFIEASRVLATKLLIANEDDVEAMVEQAFRLLTSRIPTKHERVVLVALYQEQLAGFQAEPERAAELNKIGEVEVPESISAIRVAAATVMVNSIMNLDETVRQR